MNAIRQIVNSTNGKLTINIPKEFKQKQFEVIILPINETNEIDLIKSKMNSFINSLPAEEPRISEKEIMKEIKKVRSER